MNKKRTSQEKQTSKRKLLILDILITVVVIAILGLVRPDILVILVYALLVPYLIVTRRKILFYHLILSSVVAISWMILAYSEYEYNFHSIVLFGFNLFPLFAWALGLFSAYIIYSHFEHKFHGSSFLGKLAIFTALYIPLLIVVETVSYYLFSIQNVAAAVYPGLPICNCIRAPPWMQISYFLLGLFYFALCYFLNLENPHNKRLK